MALTAPQLQTLKAAIAADPELSLLPLTSSANFTIAAAMNVPAAPAYTVWRTRVTDEEIMLNGFDWTRVDNLTVGKSRIWDWMFRFGAINPSKPNIRAGIDAAWVGAAADLAVRAAVYVHCKRLALRGEALFAVGVGSDASPAVMAYEGALTPEDVELARES